MTKHKNHELNHNVLLAEIARGRKRERKLKKQAKALEKYALALFNTSSTKHQQRRDEFWRWMIRPKTAKKRLAKLHTALIALKNDVTKDGGPLRTKLHHIMKDIFPPPRNG